MPAELVVIGIAAVLGYALYRWRMDTAESLFETIQSIRTVVFGIVGLIIAVFLISSGYLPYMLIGAFFIVVGVWWVLFEEPHERALEVVR